MRKYFLLLILFVSVGIVNAQVEISTAYNYSPDDTVLSGLKSIRGMDYHPDPCGDGRSGIVLTNYSDLGHVHVFAAAADDSIELVWSSPTVPQGGGSSTPRYVKFGDLDNDGIVEIIYQSNGNGVYIYEWDNVAGSFNFGTQPSQVIITPPISGLVGNTEYFEVTDVDGDSQNELLLAYNSSPAANDKFYVIGATGNWSTGDPGFSGFTLEQEYSMTDLLKWGSNGQSPYALISANLDGEGNDEIICHIWNYMDVFPIRVPSANTYQLSDTLNGKQNILLGGDGVYDDVALFGGMSNDIDGDGREEVYLPVYYADPVHAGWVWMIHYESGQSTAEIDSSNTFLLDMSSINQSVGFGYGYGDLDANTKPNLYFSSVYPYNVVSAEFQGGNKTDANNWIYSVVYAGEEDIYTAITIVDSMGTVDTTSTVQTAFASKIFSANTDYDKDGYQDILLPYQALNDSVTISNLVWNSSTSQFDTTVTTVINPKRWGFRILESTSPSVGIKAKDIAIVTPDDYQLEQNYPNPFNPNTTIRFILPLDKKISLKVYDILGNEVKTLINNQEFQKGAYEVTWDGTNNFNQSVASGQYIYTLKYGNFTKSMKMTLLK